MAKKIIKATLQGLRERIEGSGPINSFEFNLSNSGTTNIGSGLSPFIVGTSPLATYSTIQEALNAAVAESIQSQFSQTVLVESGLYNEDILVICGNTTLKTLSDSRDVGINGTIEFRPRPESVDSTFEIKGIQIFPQSGSTEPLIKMDGNIDDKEGFLSLVNCSIYSSSEQEALFVSGSYVSPGTRVAIEDCTIGGQGPSNKPVMFFENCEVSIAKRGLSGIYATLGQERTVLEAGLNTSVNAQSTIFQGGSSTSGTVKIGNTLTTLVTGIINPYGGPAFDLSVSGSRLETYTSAVIGVPSVSSSVNPASVFWQYGETFSPGDGPPVTFTNGILTGSASSPPTPV